MRKTKKNKGFTLIEILVVIGLIAILATVVLIAINPARQFAQSRNTQRSSNVNAILNAVGQYVADHKGELPAGVPAKGDDPEEISETLCGQLVPTYLASLPTDPRSDIEGASISDCSTWNDGDVAYEISQDDNGRITVWAPETELKDEDDAPTYNCAGETTENICVTR